LLVYLDHRQRVIYSVATAVVVTLFFGFPTMWLASGSDPGAVDLAFVAKGLALGVLVGVLLYVNLWLRANRRR
jgi:hypothetical protein